MTLEKQIIFLLNKCKSLESKLIVSTLLNQGFTKQSIRNALAKMKQAEYIYTEKRGLYSPTKKGLSVYAETNPKHNFYYHKWDGQWLIVLIGIPEAQRKKRDTFRTFLMNGGFGHLYNNVYIYPWDISESIIDTIDTLELENYVTIVRSDDFLFNKITEEGFTGPNAVRRIWNLDHISSMYTEQLKIVQDLKHNITDLMKESTGNYQNLISHLLKLTTIKEKLLEKDPMLPPDFLPGSWTGGDVLALIEDQLNKLTAFLQASDKK
ncbi:PaaX family transcriptional regulator C-terminal domain-containing protein [Alkalicoccobacillus gibsonii]|uniref:PaaX family transcriptional regulator C-terminal domain-containing protein n=1 Tax=Alkalicoccobacillus gibsonii TaxID=79881 RepID=A0ABU9VFH2_9BACI